MSPGAPIIMSSIRRSITSCATATPASPSFLEMNPPTAVAATGPSTAPAKTLADAITSPFPARFKRPFQSTTLQNLLLKTVYPHCPLATHKVCSKREF